MNNPWSPLPCALPTPPLFPPPYQPLIDNVVDYLKAQFKGRVVFRTTAPGHPQCWLHETPRNASYDYAGFLGPQSQEYQWWHCIADFNAYAARRFSELDRSLVLNVEPLARQRTDGHMLGPWNDCLHYHLPGPVDWWVVLFFNLLQATATPPPDVGEEVQEMRHRHR